MRWMNEGLSVQRIRMWEALSGRNKSSAQAGEKGAASLA